MSKTNKHSPEVRERAVRLAQEARKDYPSRWSVVESIAPKIGCAAATRHDWAKRHEVDTGVRDGIPTAERERIKTLGRPNKELRQANEILRRVRAFVNCRSSVESTQKPSTPGSDVAPRFVWLLPADGPSGVRHRGRVSLIWALIVELRDPSVAMQSERHKLTRRGRQ